MRLLGALSVVVLLAGCAATPTLTPESSSPPTTTTATTTTASISIELPDGRTAQLRGLGGAHATQLIDRITAELPAAAAAVSDFWGPDWPREIAVVVTGSEEQFGALAHAGSDIAAATTAEGMVFAPGAAKMSDDALRIVVRHELFHYAARARTVADAPLWLTEGVADYVARPATAVPGPQRAAELARLPSDTDLQTAGAARSLGYDRAWWFSRYIADRYGPGTLRELYLRAAGPGHPDVATAVRDTLGAGIDEVVVQWRQWMNG